MTTSTPLQATIDHWEKRLKEVESHPLSLHWSNTITAKDLRLFVNAAKQLEVLQAELKQERIWKEEDPRMLREQMRVHDVAFQHLHDQHKALQSENEGLKASNAEHRRVKEFGFLEMMDENTTLILDRDSLKSALESMTKERDDLFKKIERLVGATGQDNLTGVCNLIESTRNENAKLLEMFKSISCECRIYEGVTVVCTRCEAISTTTPPTNADNSKEGK